MQVPHPTFFNIRNSCEDFTYVQWLVPQWLLMSQLNMVWHIVSECHIDIFMGIWIGCCSVLFNISRYLIEAIFISMDAWWYLRALLIHVILKLLLLLLLLSKRKVKLCLANLLRRLLEILIVCHAHCSLKVWTSTFWTQSFFTQCFTDYLLL